MYTRHDTTRHIEGHEATEFSKDSPPRPADRGGKSARAGARNLVRVDSLPFSTCCPPPRGIGIDPLFGPRICCQRVAVVPPRILILARQARRKNRGSRGVLNRRDRSLHGTRATRKRSRNMVSVEAGDEERVKRTSSVRERAPLAARRRAGDVSQSISRPVIERAETSRVSRVAWRAERTLPYRLAARHPPAPDDRAGLQAASRTRFYFFQAGERELSIYL